MITLFTPYETDFSHNGIGNLDYHIIDPVVEEELNGLYKFTFRYPLFAPHGLEIEGQSILRVPVPGMDDQLFRVYRPVKSMGYITVSCYHIFYDLSDNFIEDTNIVEKDGQGAIQQLGGATQFGHNFRFFSDIQTVANARMVRRNPVAALLDDELSNSFVSRWGGELIRNNFDVRMNRSAGSDRGFTVKDRKNLIGYEADVDISTVITRIMPQGFDGLFLPEKYIDSPLIGNYETPKIRKIDYNDIKAAIGEYSNDEDAIPLDDAYAELRRLANEEYSIHKVDVPTVQYKVNFVTLEQTEEYKDLEDLQNLKMGDMVTVDHEADDFQVTAKLVRYKYDPIAKRYLLAELGSIHDGISNKFTDINKINRKVDEIAERTLIIQSTADGKNTIYRAEPSNPNLGDLWFKPNGSETEMYQFVEEGGQRFWKLIADTADVTSVINDVEQVINDSTEARNKADEAVANANLATQNATEAITQAQGAFDAVESLSEVVDEQTGEISTIKQTAQGLQSAVFDGNGESRITQLAGVLESKISTIDADNKFATQSQLTQTASSLTSTITSVRTDLDDLEISDINLLQNSRLNYLLGTGTLNTVHELYDDPLEGVVLKSDRPYIQGPDFSVNEFIPSGTELTFLFYIKATSVGTFNFQLYDGVSLTGGTITKQVSTEWQLITHTVKITKDLNVFPTRMYIYPVAGNPLYIKWVKIVRGNKTSESWSPALEDTQSQITQLSDNINLRVQKGDVINQINLSTETILIAGRKIHITGQTTIDNASIKSAHIQSLDAGKLTTGTLDAGKVNVINLDASNINTGKLTAVDIVGVNIFGSVVEGTVLKSSDRPNFDDPTFTNKAEFRAGFINFQSRIKKLGSNEYDTTSLQFNGAGIMMVGTHSEFLGAPPEWTRNNEYVTFNSNGIRATAASGKSASTFVFSIDRMRLASSNSTFEQVMEIDVASGLDIYRPDGAIITGANFKGLTSFIGSKSIQLRGGTSNHCYIEFYKDGLSLTGLNRGGYLGFGSSGATNMLLKCEIGDVSISNKDGNGLTASTDNTGGRIYSMPIYNRTYTNAANMHVTSAGTLGRSTSARKYKLLEEPINFDPYKILEVLPKTWYDKSATEAYANYLDNIESISLEESDIPLIKRIPGLVAEDVRDAGLDMFVNYNDETNEIEGLMYDRLWSLLIPIVKDHEDKLSEIEQLIFKIANLENRLSKLEVA